MTINKIKIFYYPQILTQIVVACLLLLNLFKFQGIINRKYKQEIQINKNKEMKNYSSSNESQSQLKFRQKHPNFLILATVQLGSVYAQCNEKYKNYVKKPKRLITQPSEAIDPIINDNKQWNYIFYVHDVVTNEKRKIDYEVEDLLGKGTFGQVILCKNNQGHRLAIKVIKNKPAYTNQGVIEAKVLRQLSKYNKISTWPIYLRMYDAFMWKGHFCIVQERMDNSLLDIIQQSNYQGIGIKWIQKWIKTLLLSLLQIHSLGIIHCDIKPENIMFRPNDSDHPVIIDFSSACFDNHLPYTYIQSRFYRAPEVLLGLKPYSHKIDVWSLACVLLELYIGLPIFPGSSAFDQWGNVSINSERFPSKDQITRSEFGLKYFNMDNQPRLYTHLEYQKMSGQTIRQSKNYFKIKCIDQLISDRNIPNLQLHELFIDLVKRMLVVDPNKRISAQQAYLHPFCGGLRSDLQSTILHTK